MKKLLSIGLCTLLIVMISGCSQSGALYQDGRKSFENKNYEDAAAFFASAIEDNPNRADYYIDYGLTLIKLGRYEEALAEFDQAYVNKENIIVSRNNKRVYRGRGIAYYYMADYENSIQEFNKALELGESSDLNQDILQYVGSAQMALGYYEKAIKTYSDLLKISSKCTEAYNSRALCYRYLGEYDKSMKDYDKAIALEPRQYSNYFGKYYLLEERGDTTTAGEVLTKAAKIEVKTGEDKYQLAKIHYYQGDYEKALSELNGSFTEGFQEAYYYIGEIYRIKKDYPKAIYYYEIFIKEGNVLSPNVYNQIAVCEMKGGNYDAALKYLEKGIAIHHAGVQKILLMNEIITYESLGEYSRAKDKMDEYLSLYPKEDQIIKEAGFIDTRLIKAEIPVEE